MLRVSRASLAALARRSAEPFANPLAETFLTRHMDPCGPNASMANDKGVLHCGSFCKVAERFFLDVALRGDPAQLSLQALDFRG